MTTTILIIGAAVGGGLFGVIAMQIAQRTKAGNRIKKSEQQAKRIIKKAHQESDRIKKDKMLQAKERFIELKAEHEKVIFNREKRLAKLKNAPVKKRILLIKNYLKLKITTSV